MDELTNQAERAASDVDTWAYLSHLLFNPVVGLVAEAYRMREAREAFIQTEQFAKIHRLMSDAGGGRAGRGGDAQEERPVRGPAASGSKAYECTATVRWSRRRHIFPFFPLPWPGQLGSSRRGISDKLERRVGVVGRMARR
jgi:hypothetical protein